MRKFWLAILLAAVPLFGQLPSYSVTISSTRQIVVQPDQVLFGLSVSSGPSTNLGQVVTALASLGITSANLTGVQNSDPATLQWTFSLATPLTSLIATINSLTALQQTIGQNNSGLALTYYIAGTQISQQLQQSAACSDSIADATAQAQKLVTAAGMTLGPILKLSNTPLASTAVRPVIEFLSGAFSEFVYAPPPQPINCLLSVQFQLLR
jgi:hypothetical protein